jgi:hypothetical protein
MRLFGGALVSSELRSLPEIAAISPTAAKNAASLAFDGLLKPLTFLTNCNAAARISSSLTGGWKLKRVLMFLHTAFTSPLSDRGIFIGGTPNHDTMAQRQQGSDHWRRPTSVLPTISARAEIWADLSSGEHDYCRA